jgi:hypothetical protein
MLQDVLEFGFYGFYLAIGIGGCFNGVLVVERRRRIAVCSVWSDKGQQMGGS